MILCDFLGPAEVIPCTSTLLSSFQYCPWFIFISLRFYNSLSFIWLEFCAEPGTTLGTSLEFRRSSVAFLLYDFEPLWLWAKSFRVSDSSCIFVLLESEWALQGLWLCAHMVTSEIYLWVSTCHQGSQKLYVFGEKFSSEIWRYIFSAFSWPAKSIYRLVVQPQMFLQLERGKDAPFFLEWGPT